MRILVVESGEGMRTAIASALATEGHEIVYAKGCAEALRQFEIAEPDLVLMDVVLFDGDGYRCAQRVQALGEERFAPVVLTTAIDDEEMLRRFLDSGASDFLDAPHDPLLLRAKIAGYERSSNRYRRLESLREKLKFAKHMFDAVLKRNSCAPAGIDCWGIGAGHFCGDLVIHESTPDGRLNLMLGDFTGHGLAATVGAVPASDAFFAMSCKGLPLCDIAGEINAKLHRLLPMGHFCAAALVSLDACGHLEVWNGGQPPLLLLDREHREIHRFASRHLPLGILGKDNFGAGTETFDAAACHHLLFYSDGLIEARNPVGETFGEAGLRATLDGLRRRTRKTSLLQGIKTRLIAFLDGMEPHDDVSVLAVELPALARA